MSTTRDEHHPVSWESVLAAINPRQGLAGADFQQAINTVTTAQQEGYLADEEASEIIKVMLAISLSGGVNAIVNDFFTTDERGSFDIGFGGRALPQQNRRFSLT